MSPMHWVITAGDAYIVTLRYLDVSSQLLDLAQELEVLDLQLVVQAQLQRQNNRCIKGSSIVVVGYNNISSTRVVAVQ